MNMASGKARIERLEEDLVKVTIPCGQLVVEWTLREAGHSANDWRALSFVTRVDAGTHELSPADVRGLPIASTLKAAQAAARGKGVSRRIASITDPPAVWREDGRGRGRQRTLRDYAELASSYASADEKGRTSLPQLWSSRFGGSPKTWQNRVSEARTRGFLDSQGSLTRLAETTLYGDWLEIEQKVHDAELRAKGIWSDEQRERDRRAGVSEKFRLKDDDRLLRAYYPDDEGVRDERMD